MAHKFVRDDGLDKEREKSVGEDLREGHDIELLEILQELVMVVACDCLHDNADQHGDGEEDQLDHGDGGEAGEPIGGLAQRQSIMYAAKLSIAFAPKELRGVECRDDVEEESGAALD